MIFLDASVLLAAEDTDDSQHDAANALLRTGALATLELALYETTNVAIARWHDPEAAKRLAQRIWSIAELGNLVRVDLDLSDKIAELAVTERPLIVHCSLPAAQPTRGRAEAPLHRHDDGPEQPFVAPRARRGHLDDRLVLIK